MTKRVSVVVGGGLAGLTAAIFLARGGQRAILLEQSRELGGRSRTTDVNGYRLNFGPHALSMCEDAISVLREIGIEPDGSRPSTAGVLVGSDRLHALPGSLGRILSTSALSLGSRLKFFGAVRRVMTANATAADFTSAKDWLDANIEPEDLRKVIGAFFTLAAYSGDVDKVSAGMLLRRMQSTGQNVRYLHHGWAAMVDQLHRAAVSAGVEIRHGIAVRDLEVADGKVVALVTANERIVADNVVLAVPPDEARRLASRHTPIVHTVAARAFCMDIALQSLPNPAIPFALGLEEPWYFSVHSASARLAQGQGAVIHAARFLREGEDTSRTRQQLELLMDTLQPGWRKVLVHARVLPNIAVAGALPLAQDGGEQGRQPVFSERVEGLAFAGDWVGPQGYLADAAFSSGRKAALGLMARATLQGLTEFAHAV